MTPSNPHSSTVAYLCPGQGAQSPAMLPQLIQHHKTRQLLNYASDLLREDLTTLEQQPPSYFSRNEISAVLVSLSSIAAYDEISSEYGQPNFIAGYSVGQWTAMHLAGMLSAEQLIELLIRRAQLMNKTKAVESGSMLAVIGIQKPELEQILSGIDGYITIANLNAPAQFTLSGETSAIDQAEQKLIPLKPQRLLRVPVAGSWHCALVSEATAPFRAYMESIILTPPRIPVISNVTAAPLVSERDALLDELAAHLVSPVRWEETMRYLMAQGVQQFIEVGHETTLSKFGFFIDRSYQHLPWQKALAAKRV